MPWPLFISILHARMECVKIYENYTWNDNVSRSIGRASVGVRAHVTGQTLLAVEYPEMTIVLI